MCGPPVPRMTPAKLARAALPLLLALALPWEAAAQVSTPSFSREPGFSQAVSFGASVGSPYLRDAYFWGLTGDYTRCIADGWTATISLAYDQEHERMANDKRSVVNTLSLVTMVNYNLTSWLTATTGVGKGFLDDDNSTTTLRFTNGDWGTGVALGFSLPYQPLSRHGSLGLSGAWEYNLTKREPQISLDLSLGWSW